MCKGDHPNWRKWKPLGNQTNPSTNPTVFSVGSVPIAVYKSASVFTSYIKGTQSPDLHVGPHYHVTAHHTHHYSRAYAAMVLPTVKPPAGKTLAWCYEIMHRKDNPAVTYVWRTPRLGLRVEAKGGIDLRLENKGKGWTPTYYADASNEGPNSKNQTKFNPAKLPVHDKAVTATILVECAQNKTTDILKATFKLLDKKGTVLSTTTLLYVRPSGAFFNPGPTALVPKLRFARYMAYVSKSGLPDALYDEADKCEMTGAKFKNLQLYNRTSKAWLPWEWSRIEYAWSSQPPNIPTLDIASSTATKRDTDIFSCKPQEWYQA
ncbi:NADH-quinone oxidoreductase subunit L [Chlorella sorokiniana]|uniref:NADH-quinone oxidoreductase subunit L n=1 Tax=Chlorella sorokiniana TaxID=3076 RepID=A0A2P6U4L0_CHLSO|nr:NADH-quinone oxidoreductase subunit L [Chlorella sorokiniana]|eukprot:PRW61245.1 NADH-quinone oxidoreductase subunit L [Chlorella sorokiniana]